MKVLVALALAFLLGTSVFTVAHNVFHHEDEPEAVLPTASPKKEAAPKLEAKVPLTIGATSLSNVADSRTSADKLIVNDGDGAASVDKDARRAEVRALSNGAAGRSIWLALLGSDITVTKGELQRAKAVVRFDGLSWHGVLRSDGGTASVKVRAQVQTSTGEVLGDVTVADEQLTAAGDKALDVDGQATSVDVTVETKGRSTLVLRAFVSIQVEAAGGKGGTSVTFSGTAGGHTLGVSYASIAVAIGAAPPTTIPAAPSAGITMAQLAQHASETSCWLLIQGRVYDFTPYMRRHPGSRDPVLRVCGKDATEAFLTQGGRGSRHSYEAVAKLKDYYIGDLAG